MSAACVVSMQHTTTVLHSMSSGHCTSPFLWLAMLPHLIKCLSLSSLLLLFTYLLEIGKGNIYLLLSFIASLSLVIALHRVSKKNIHSYYWLYVEE